MNPLSFIYDQLPLHALSEISKDSGASESIFIKDKFADEGTIWEIISNNPRYGVLIF